MTKYLSEKNIRSRARQLLEEAGVDGPPVPVDLVAEVAGAEIRREPLDTDLSGLLHEIDGITIIGVNSAHPKMRQRFTIAHEIGHLVLHGNGPFVDRQFPTYKRDPDSASGEIADEIQANMLAAELLMPYAWIKRDVRSRQFDIDDDSAIQDLARRYQVSGAAMSFRLTNLDLIDP